MQDEEKIIARTLLIFIRVALAGTTLVLITALVQSHGAFSSRVLSGSVGACACLIVLWLLHIRQYTVPSYFLPSVTYLLATYLIFSGTTVSVRDDAVVLYPLTVAMAGLLLRRRGVVIFGILSATTIAISVYAEIQGMIANHITAFTATYGTLITACVTYGLTFTMMYILVDILTNSLARSRASQHELALSYDDTLLGWAKALELREHETAGHSYRVVRLTLQLAAEVGISPEQLVHIHRGALLHDIGKMGISDIILLKPAPLTPDEWAQMHRHPVYAYELLHRIKFLEPALNIPYAHHEKWDGTGYPRGLKGEEIPFEARIFAFVDVWDALRSDRPYRKSMPREEVIQYVRDHSGTHFDPNLTEQFIKMMEQEP